MKNLLVICGPTASGKTALGVALALRHNGEIVSCDSRQVYRGMDIGTGKDLGAYRTHDGTVPYHLIDIVDPAEVYTVYRYQRDCYRTLREIMGHKRLPVIVGGSGLYLEAVLRDYRISAVPEDPALRARLMARDKESLVRELEALDPQRFAVTDCSSKKRIVRSLEVAHRRTTVFSEDVPDPDAQRPAVDPLVIGVRWERHLLRERIRARLEQRFAAGMVEEVRRLLDTGIAAERFAMFGLEYGHIARFIRGEVDFETMKQGLYTAICRFAKRQETYFRGMERRGVEIHWVEEGRYEEAERVVEQGLREG